MQKQNIIVSGCGNVIGRYVCKLISGNPEMEIVAGLTGTNESIINFDFDLFCKLKSVTAGSLPFIGNYVAALLADLSADTSAANWNPCDGYKFPIYPYEKIQEAIEYSITEKNVNPAFVLTCDTGLNNFSSILQQYDIMEIMVQPDFPSASRAVMSIPHLL